MVITAGGRRSDGWRFTPLPVEAGRPFESRVRSGSPWAMVNFANLRPLAAHLGAVWRGARRSLLSALKETPDTPEAGCFVLRRRSGNVQFIERGCCHLRARFVLARFFQNVFATGPARTRHIS